MSTGFIDPAILSGIKDLSLVAKTVIDSFMNGSNKSLLRGEGIEFSQYRSYQPGDDLRQLDWKMFARSDRYYIRESQIDASINIRFILDTSASMRHEDSSLKKGKGITKIDYARFIIASLAWLAYKQGDAVGLNSVGETGALRIEPRHSFQHLNNIWHQLEKLDATGTFPASGSLPDGGSQKKELVIFLTDFYEKDGEISRYIEACHRRRNEVLVFHLMARNEMNFTWPDNSSLEDLESGTVLEVNRSQMEADYLNSLAVFLKQTRSAMLSRQISYQLFVLDQPVDQAIKEFLLMRKRIPA